jgi:hypothetical protein
MLGGPNCGFLAIRRENDHTSATWEAAPDSIRGCAVSVIVMSGRMGERTLFNAAKRQTRTATLLEVRNSVATLPRSRRAIPARL